MARMPVCLAQWYSYELQQVDVHARIEPDEDAEDSSDTKAAAQTDTGRPAAGEALADRVDDVRLALLRLKDGVRRLGGTPWIREARRSHSLGACRGCSCFGARHYLPSGRGEGCERGNVCASNPPFEAERHRRSPADCCG